MRASISTWRTGMSSVRDQLADVGDAVGGVLDQQRVGALVDADAAAAESSDLPPPPCDLISAAMSAALA